MSTPCRVRLGLLAFAVVVTGLAAVGVWTLVIALSAVPTVA